VLLPGPAQPALILRETARSSLVGDGVTAVNACSLATTTRAAGANRAGDTTGPAAATTPRVMTVSTSSPGKTAGVGAPSVKTCGGAEAMIMAVAAQAVVTRGTEAATTIWGTAVLGTENSLAGDGVASVTVCAITNRVEAARRAAVIIITGAATITSITSIKRVNIGD